MRSLIASLLLVALVGCGGGGPDSGACLYAGPECSGGSGSQTPFPPDNNPAFSRSGVGDATFSLPATTTVIRIQARFGGPSAPFVVHAGADLLVNTLVGTTQAPPVHDGTYAVAPGATVTISNANGVDWTVSATSAQPPGGGALVLTGTGDRVFDLPPRSARYRVQATFPGPSSSFVVVVAGTRVVDTFIGDAENPVAFDGTYALPAGARVEIRNAPGVLWRFDEVP